MISCGGRVEGLVALVHTTTEKFSSCETSCARRSESGTKLSASWLPVAAWAPIQTCSNRLEVVRRGRCPLLPVAVCAP